MTKANIGYKFRVNNEKGAEADIEFTFSNIRKYGTYIPQLKEFKYISKNTEIDFIKISKNSFSNNMLSFLENLKAQNNESLSIKKFKSIFNKFLPKGVQVQDSRNFIFPLNFTFESPLIEELERDLRKIRYLSPIRANPERIYIHYAKNASNINESGSNSAHVLWTRKNEQVFFDNKKISLIEALKECITLVGLGQEINPDKIGEMVYQVGLKLQNSTSTVSLADVGFGYSQILPVMLLGLLNNDNNLLLIEQPEIHLHPSSASKLADLFIKFIKDKKKFIIETHSQDLINKLRLRVIQDPSLKELINIVFVDQDEDGTQIKQFSIDDSGMFPEWPKGFLDESESLAQEILLARIRKYNV